MENELTKLILENATKITACQNSAELTVLTAVDFHLCTARKIMSENYFPPVEKSDTQCHDDLGCGEDPCICRYSENEYNQYLGDRLGGG